GGRSRGGERAGPPRPEVRARAPGRARARILRQGAAPQQGGQRALDPAGVPAGEVHAENRFVHTRGAALIATDRLAAPFGACPVGVADARSRHLERRRAQAGRQRPLPRAMAVALALLADTHRFPCAEGGIELLLPQLLDRGADPQPHRLLDAVTAELRNLFLVTWLPGTVLHRVILRHPPPGGRSSWC